MIQYSMVVDDDAHTRWNMLFHKWIVNLGVEENETSIKKWLGRPIWELTRIILEARGACGGREVN